MTSQSTITRHVSLADLALMLGVGRSTILSWTKQGMPYEQRADRNLALPWIFDTVQVVRWLEARASRAAVNDMPTDYVEAKARKLAAEAELTEIRLAKERGDALSAHDVERTWTGLVTNFRAKMLAIPHRLAPILVSQLNERVIANTLKAEIHEALDELSRGKPPVDIPGGE